jgi:hypothetical protein
MHPLRVRWERGKSRSPTQASSYASRESANLSGTAQRGAGLEIVGQATNSRQVGF